MIHIQIDGVPYGMENRKKKLKDRRLLKEFFDLPPGNFNMLAVIIRLEELGFEFSDNYSFIKFKGIPRVWNPILGSNNGDEVLSYTFDNCVSAVEMYKKK